MSIKLSLGGLVQISYEQFVKVLPNDFARRTMGIDMAADQLKFLLAEEAHQIAFYDEWTRMGQPRNGKTDQTEPSAAKSESTPRASAAAPGPARPRLPMAPASVVAFVFAILAFFISNAVVFGLITSLIGVVIGSFALSTVDWKRSRGRGLAIAAVIVAGVAFFPAVIYTIIYWTTGNFPTGTY